ncbi:MAG: hypothetical protein Q8K64_10615 [Sediminibacterium sp.]|nr:hypothetical protein [Sediminibacterium sp.]
MKNKNILTWILLIVLTLITTIIAGMGSVAYLILVVAALKFLLIAFQFMEFKKAHLFWKATLVIVLIFITGTIIILVAT